MSNKYAAPIEMGGYAITGLGGAFGPSNALNGALADARYLQLAGGTLTGAVLFPVGSETTPSITFTGDTNTGFYRPGADSLAAVVNGTNVIFITSSGVSTFASLSEFSLGIGSTSNSSQTALGNFPVATFANTNATVGNGLGFRFNIADTSGTQRSAVQLTAVSTAKTSSTVSARFATLISGTERSSLSATGLAVEGVVKTLTYTVATLPAAGTVGAGSRAAVTDANATTFNSTVAGGGANFVPVISNGTNWLIG